MFGGCIFSFMQYTGADGVMTSEAILENAALFTDRIHPDTGLRVSQVRWPC